MRTPGLRWKLMALVLLSVLPGGLLTGHLIGRQRAMLARSAREGLLPVARLLAATHDGALEAAHASLERVAGDPRVRSLEPGRCRAALLELVRENPVYSGLAVVDARGTVVCTSVAAPLSRSLADRAYIREAVRTQEFAVGRYEIGRLTGKGSLHVACPILESGRVIGAVAGPLDLSHLSRSVAAAALPAGSVLSVVDGSGRFLLRFPEPERWIGTSAGAAMLAGLSGGDEGTLETPGLDGVDRYFAYTRLRALGDAYLVVGSPRGIVLADADQVLRQTLLGVAAALLAVFIGTFLYAERRILRRVSALGDAARRFSDGDLDARVAVDGEGDEISQAGRVLNDGTAKLQRLIARHTLVLESVAEAIFGVDREGRVRFANSAAALLLGRERAALLDGNLHELCHPEKDAEQCGLVQALRQGVPFAGELSVTRPDGTGVSVECSMGLVEAGGPDLSCVVVMRDMTEPRKLQAQLQAAQKLESVGRLAGGVAHDFNNILTAMMGYTDFCLAGSEPGSRLRGDLEEVKKAGQRGSALTRQLLAFSRKQVLNPRSLDLNEVLRGIEKMLKRLVPEDVTLSLELAEGLEPVFADPGQLEQVVMNLAVNARDAMPRGGRVTLGTSRVDLDAAFCEAHLDARPGPYVRLSVRDEGTGIAPEHLARIFEPFFTTKEPGKGTGLGLSMVHGIVKQSSGFIQVESSPGAGTTFHIHLPPAASARPAAAAEAPVRGPADAAPAATILLVEDDLSVRRFAARVLGEAGHEVIEAGSPAEALELARRRDRRIDLMVSDIVMPQMRGPELAALVKEARPGLSAVFMSGFAEEAVAAEGLRPGENFLEKPLTAEALTRFVAEALRRRSA